MLFWNFAFARNTNLFSTVAFTCKKRKEKKRETQCKAAVNWLTDRLMNTAYGVALKNISKIAVAKPP